MWKRYASGLKTALVATKWITEIALLILFWIVVLPSYMRIDYFSDGHMGDIVRHIIHFCAKPSIDDLTRRLTTIIVINLIFNFSVRFGKLTTRSYHILSLVTGLSVLSTNSYPRNLVLIFAFLLITCLLLKYVQYVITYHQHTIRPVYVVALVEVVILITGELYFPDYHNWQECRGVLMIIAMKIISLSTEDNRLVDVTSLELLGYLLCPATVLFGPWIIIQEYRLYNTVHAKLNWKWVVKIVQILTYAMLSMVLSNCLHRMLLITAAASQGKWNEAFHSAWSFRASNYFIGYMAELSMITAGFNYIHENPSGRWQYSVCRPFAVEFPRSIAVVVRNWNIPVHRFLKHYVYIPFAEVGKPYAIVITFFVSSLLHGLNIRITIILISLGLLSLSQQVLQNKLANRINSCCRINSCRPNCGHRFGFYHPITLFINGFNMVLNIIHLAYLGYIMDDHFASSTCYDLYHMWDQDFGMLSHHILIFWFATMLLFG